MIPKFCPTANFFLTEYHRPHLGAEIATEVLCEACACKKYALCRFHLFSEAPLERSFAMRRNCSKADSRSSTISWAMMSGAGRLSDDSRDSSLSQKMSRLALSRVTNSS